MPMLDDDWESVKIDEGLEFPVEETSTLALVRDLDSKVIALFPRGTEQRVVSDIATKIPGVSVWIVKIKAKYEVVGVGKKLGTRKAKR